MDGGREGGREGGVKKKNGTSLQTLRLDQKVITCNPSLNRKLIQVVGLKVYDHFPTLVIP